MARKNNNTHGSRSTIGVIVGAIALFIIFVIGNQYDIDILNQINQVLESSSLENVQPGNNSSTTTYKTVDGQLIVDYIDVGQGDSILIRQGEYTMLIDGGTTESKDDLLNFLAAENVDKFEYVVGTHAHEDHIGSLDDVINAYDVDEVLFPKTSNTTKTFINLVTAVKNKGMQFTAPVVGTEYELGDATFVIYAPLKESYSNANNYSIVIKMTYGSNTFMFTGDAETEVETELLNSGFDLKADVLKLGHHGSSTSTSVKYLTAVSPRYAVISCGVNNKYNHPTKTTITKLKERNIPVYRTDEEGTIEAVSDGTNITFNVKPGSYSYMGE